MSGWWTSYPMVGSNAHMSAQTQDLWNDMI